MASILQKIIQLFIGKKEEISQSISSSQNIAITPQKISSQQSNISLRKKNNHPVSRAKKNPTKQKPVTETSRINIPRLETRIKKNILFLYELSLALQVDQKYASYLAKVLDMKEQSEACLKMLFKLDKKAPYFYNTVRLILNHAEVISELRKTH